MNNIKEILKELGTTQVQLARRVGISQSATNHYINAHRKPDIVMCWRIVNSLRSLGAKCGFEDVFPDNAQTQKSA